jgi:hypothetical protein
MALAMALVAAQPARADFELTDSKGRRILLKDDGTWRYVDGKATGAVPAVVKDAAKPEELADLQATARVNAPGGCRFELTLTNGLPYEISSLVPSFAAVRANGIVYMTKSLGFGPVRPGDKSRRFVQFDGITCPDIAKVRVLDGDRCEMGDLTRFSDAKGSCLARLRLLASEVVPFER